MVAGKGDQIAAKVYDTETFSLLIDRLTHTTEYLCEQVKVGAALFDSWDGSLGGTHYQHVFDPIKKNM